jgi:hypothetical protein
MTTVFIRVFYPLSLQSGFQHSDTDPEGLVSPFQLNLSGFTPTKCAVLTDSDAEQETESKESLDLD